MILREEVKKGHDNIFDNDDALDFIIYEDLEKQDQKRKGGGKGGCLSIVVLLLLPMTSIFLTVIAF
jgi:hypothetical protein